MFFKGFKHQEINESLAASSGFIGKSTQRYEESRVPGLQLDYPGSNGYLEPEQRQKVIDWLKRKNYWNLAELQQYIEQKYEVAFNSQQSYYTLFEQAGISWKKMQERHSKADPDLVEKKQQISVPITNQRSKQTYYGAMDLYTQ